MPYTFIHSFIYPLIARLPFHCHMPSGLESGIPKRERKPDDCCGEYSGTRTSVSGMRGRCRSLLALAAVVEDGRCTCSLPAFPLRDTLVERGGWALALTALRVALTEATTSATAAAATTPVATAATTTASALRHTHRRHGIIILPSRCIKCIGALRCTRACLHRMRGLQSGLCSQSRGMLIPGLCDVLQNRDGDHMSAA